MLDINITPYQGILFVRLKGSLNKNSLEKLRREVSELIQKIGVKNIVFNLKELDEIDYSGIKELSKNYTYCTNNFGKAIFVSDKKESYAKSCFKDDIVDDERSACNLINI